MAHPELQHWRQSAAARLRAAPRAFESEAQAGVSDVCAVLDTSVIVVCADAGGPVTHTAIVAST